MTYFQTVKRGQLQQLQDSLNSKNLDDKRLGLKKIIAQMTLGKDLSPLFQSVLKCLEYTNLDIKKLVYLYVINYSRVRPDDAIMSISAFRKDATNRSNPIIRALAVRTMSSLRVPNLNEYLIQPLKIALKDQDPYVRKTAVLSIPKMYDIAPDDPETLNLINLLQGLIVKEPNALVLANSIASLQQIRTVSGQDYIQMNSVILGRLLVALNQCMEWAQVFILDFLCRYDPINEDEAETIVDRVLPRLSHINPTVIFGCIKLVVRYFDFLSNVELKKNLSKKIASSIISIVSFTPTEVQYVILKNIEYIIESQPFLLENNHKCFFCNFADPHYIKNEKVNILVRIVNTTNYESVLSELKEYLNQDDSEFVKKCIQSIGKIAIRYEKSVEKCLEILAKKIKETKFIASYVQHIVNELLITTKNILRKYPSRYNHDGMFPDLVSLFQYASQPESRQAAVWILGENAQQVYTISLQSFKKWISNFTLEERIVQLEILSSAVKIFIKYPDQFQTLISDLLTIATEQVDNPDIRDRAFIYWRMLSTDPNRTKNVVFGYRPQAKDNDKLLDSKFVKDMMKNLGYTSSLFQKRHEELFTKSVAQMRDIIIQEDLQSSQKSQKSEKSDASKKTTHEEKKEDPQIQTTPVSQANEKKQCTKEENLLDLI